MSAMCCGIALLYCALLRGWVACVAVACVAVACAAWLRCAW